MCSFELKTFENETMVAKVAIGISLTKWNEMKMGLNVDKWECARGADYRYTHFKQWQKGVALKYLTVFG